MSKYRKNKAARSKYRPAGIIVIFLFIGGFVYLFSELSMLSLSISFNNGISSEVNGDSEDKTLTIFTTVMRADV